MNETELSKICDALTSGIGSLVEPISMKEFYTRMGISRTKAFQLKREGLLIKGRHYLQFGRKIIFLWGPHLLIQLQNDCCNDSPDKSETSSQKGKAVIPKKHIRRRNKQSIIDENYCLND